MARSLSSSRRGRISISIDTPESRWPYVSWVALAIAVVLVIIRLTTPEALREPWAPAVGTPVLPHGPGPAAGLMLDAMAFLPALLVLARRTFDPSYRLAMRWSFVPLLALAAWTSLSVLWSADQFAAVVDACHLCAAVAMLWAVAQLVDLDGGTLRWIAGVCFGLLLLLAVQLLIYRLIDVPADANYWEANKAEIIRQHNWEPGSFLARQMEHKLLGGEVVSFYTSPNSLAAVAVLLGCVAAMAGVQRVRDGDGPGWWGLTAAAGIATGWVLVEAQSKTSIGTPILGVGLVVGFAMYHDVLRRHPTRAYVAGGVAAGCAAAAVIGYGLYHHGLFRGHFSNSLDFRWKYWVASAALLARHPLLGVGFGNFGAYYLAVRLPDAVEEIQDPHNVLVHFATETGLVGLTLLLAWLARAGWELTRPAPAASEPNSPPVLEPPRMPMIAIAMVALLGIFGTSIVNIDFIQNGADVALEVMRRVLYALVLIGGAMLVTMRSSKYTAADTRPAPWIFVGLVIALLLMFVHNLIDFSIFEPGPMLATLLLCGVAMASATPTAGGPSARRIWAAAAGLAAAGLAWIVFVLLLVVPIVTAEQAAQTGDDAIRTNQLHVARRAYQQAMAAVPYNADYTSRAARAEVIDSHPEAAMKLFDRAIVQNPMAISSYQNRAQLELRKPNPPARRVIADYEKVIALNPNDVQLHVQYGQALRGLKQDAGAVAQFKIALAASAALGPDEPRRLTPDEVRQLSKAAGIR